MTRMGRTVLIAILCVFLGACATRPLAFAPPAEREAIAGNLMRDISILASDEFGGRLPGTEGETRTVAFLIDEMSKAGLVSGTNDPGSAWRAPVELVSTTPLDSKITVRTAKGETILSEDQGFAFSNSRRALIDGVEVVFVGNGTQPVFEEDVAGKIVVVLQDRLNTDVGDRLFAANPAAVIGVVPDQRLLGFVRQRLDRERLTLARETTNRLTAIVTREAMAASLPDGAWEAMLSRAEEPGFGSAPVEATIAIDVRTSRRDFTSSNVLGLLPGAVPGSGAILLLAHWDHLGACGDEGAEDRICNGAIDNASGIASMLELGRRLAASGPHDRDIYLLATTAEEQGLFGARTFAETPPVPLDTIVAAFNFDTVAVAPTGTPVGFVGEGRTPLDPVILEVLKDADRQLGNRDYAESFVRRQDGWALLDKGVPAVFLSTAFSSEIVLGPFLAGDYHQPGDEAERIELGGAIDDLLLHEELVRRIASTELYPS